MKRVLVLLAAAALLVAGLYAASAVAGTHKGHGAHGAPPPGHIGICHHTGKSPVHEWIFITPSADGVLNGHGKLRHQFSEDIIPPFVLVKPHGTVSYAGHNLDERIGTNLEPDPNGPFTGAEILANQCKAPTSGGGTTTGETTTVGTTTVTVPTTTTVTVTTPGTTSTVTTTTSKSPKKKHHHHKPTLSPPTLPHTQ